MELQAILDALKENPSLIEGVLPTIVESEKGKEAINNRVNAQVKDKVDEATRNIYQNLDNDMETILGRRPKRLENGDKEKTYDVIKGIYKDLKELEDKKDSLNKDAEVKRLNDKIEELKKEGGAATVQAYFDAAKEQWTEEKTNLKNQLEKLQGDNEASLKGYQIDAALAGLKFAPEIPESMINIAKANVREQLLSKSQLDNGKIVFLGNDGKPLMDKTSYNPLSASEMIKGLDIVKDIIITDDKSKGGGGADPNFKGGVQTIKVQGKDDTLKLVFPEGAIKSKTQFQDVAEKALIEKGITRENPQWDELKTEAYKEYNVSELPISE